MGKKPLLGSGLGQDTPPSFVGLFMNKVSGLWLLSEAIKWDGKLQFGGVTF